MMRVYRLSDTKPWTVYHKPKGMLYTNCFLRKKRPTLRLLQQLFVLQATQGWPESVIVSPLSSIPWFHVSFPISVSFPFLLPLSVLLFTTALLFVQLSFVHLDDLNLTWMRYRTSKYEYVFAMKTFQHIPAALWTVIKKRSLKRDLQSCFHCLLHPLFFLCSSCCLWFNPPLLSRQKCKRAEPGRTMEERRDRDCFLQECAMSITIATPNSVEKLPRIEMVIRWGHWCLLNVSPSASSVIEGFPSLTRRWFSSSSCLEGGHSVKPE